jgi:hypothetical protein
LGWVDWDKKQASTIYCIQEMEPKSKGKFARLISDKADFKPKLAEKKRSHYIDKGNNPEGDSNCKHTKTKCWHTQHHKTNTTGHKREA